MLQTLPEVNYLAKDYASFRRLMLDRLALLLPKGIQDQPADLQVALVELLAYTADHLSYYQDAVATEAYLGTARSRISLRRHARLLNYRLHEGCNARVWIYCEVTEEQNVTPDWRFLTEGPDPVVFEPCHFPRLYPQHNSIELISCEATRAILKLSSNLGRLKLEAGDLLLMKKMNGERGVPLYHVVRLTTAVALDPGDVMDVTWDPKDKLPFSIEQVAVQGNIILADHGRTLEPEQLEAIQLPLPVERMSAGSDMPSTQTLDPQQSTAKLCLRLPARMLTYAEPVADELIGPRKSFLPAAKLLSRDARRALPQIKELRNTEASWVPRLDLLESDKTDAVFVVESEHDGSTSLRFGDGMFYGRCPADPHFRIRYRVGNGRAGNVGAEAVCRVEGPYLRGVTAYNPLPAQGGEDPEPAEQVRIFAPQAFRSQSRAINAEDYARLARGFRDVRANAEFRWTGSWYSVYLFIDRQGGEPIEENFKRDLVQYLDGYRLAGYDLEIRGATYVPLIIKFAFEIKPGFTPQAVSAALKETLGKDDLPGDRRGYFHPDQWSFGDQVYLSHFYKTVLSVPGVAALDVSEFRRQDASGKGARTQGVIEIRAHEIVSHNISYQQNGLQVTIKEAV
jgi:hypothetical protein